MGEELRGGVMAVISTVDSIIRLFLALFLGGVIGYERQAQSKSAGLRTHVLVSLGSCLSMIISINIAMDLYFQYGLTNSDPERIAAQVITGIGFQGAGTILANKKDRSVMGLTTAASIWAVAALGLVVGAGYLAVAVAATAMIYLVLHVFVYVGNFLKRYAQKQYGLHLVMRNTVGQSRRLGDFFKDKGLQVLSFQSLSDEDKHYIELDVVISAGNRVDISEIVTALLTLGGIVEAKVHIPSKN